MSAHALLNLVNELGKRDNFILFDLILYVPSIIFQLNRVEPVLS